MLPKLDKTHATNKQELQLESYIGWKGKIMKNFTRKKEKEEQ